MFMFLSKEQVVWTMTIKAMYVGLIKHLMNVKCHLIIWYGQGAEVGNMEKAKMNKKDLSG